MPSGVTVWYCHICCLAMSIWEGIVKNPTKFIILCVMLGFTTHTTHLYICRQVRQCMDAFIGLAVIFLLMGLVGVAIVLGMGLMTETTNYEVSACM